MKNKTKSIVNKPASKSVTSLKPNASEKKPTKEPKSLRLKEKIPTAEGLERIRKKSKKTEK